MPTLGNLTTSTSQTDGSGNLSIAHDHNVGANGLISVTFSQPSSVGINNVTYNGVAMTLKESATFDSVTFRTYTLADPTTGTNNALIDTDTAFSTTRTAIQSFTGAILGTTQTATNTASPVTDTISVNENAKIYVIGMYDTTGATDTIKANAVTLTEDYKLVFTYTIIAGLSAAQTAGSKATEHTYSLGNDGAMFSIELEEPPTSRRIIIT